MSVIDTSIKQIATEASGRRDASLLSSVAEFFAEFQRTILDTYHPERHYMRGPGPACAKKRSASC